jgi:WD40 repeat protein
LQVVSPAPTSPALTLYDPGSTGAEGLAFSADGTLAVGDLNTRVYLWNVTTAQVTATFQVPDRQIAWSVAFSPDSGTVAGGTSNSSYNYGNIYLWDIATRKLVTTLTNPGTRGITGIAFSPDGGTLAVGDTNANTYLWDMSWLRP